MIVRLLRAAVDLYALVLIARIVFSWMPPRARASQLYEFLHAITEPVMRPMRRLIPPISGIDFSPILVFVLLAIVRHVLSRVQ